MLRSILISLTAESSYPILGPLGRPVQAWFLRQITRSNPALASRLHDVGGLKPYTVSTLLDERSRPLLSGTWLSPGETCWLRITTLNEELSDILDKTIIKRLERQIVIYKMNFRVNGVVTKRSEHEWAGETTFSDIAQDSKLDFSSNRVRMEFVSPTAFRKNNGIDVCLPVPGQIFRSIWDKWNLFAPEPMEIHELWPTFANDCIFIDELTAINSTRWKFSEGTRGAATGFTGTAGFYLPPKEKLKKEWQEYVYGANAVLQSLSMFSFYCGVGHHTTIGMGQCRQLPQFSSLNNRPPKNKSALIKN